MATSQFCPWCGAVCPPDTKRCIACQNLDTVASPALPKSTRVLREGEPPEREQRKQFLLQLRNPTGKDAQTIRELSRLANGFGAGYGDQTVQIAAISGISKIGGPEAVLAITDRVLNTYGMSVIAKAIKTLEKLRDDWGLLALTATLVCDNRFYAQKLAMLAEGVKKLHAGDTYQVLIMAYDRCKKYLPYPEDMLRAKDMMAQVLDTLSEDPLLEIRHGAVLASNIASILSLSKHLHPLSQATLEQARLYAEQCVPGLVQLIEPIEGRFSWDLCFV